MRMPLFMAKHAENLQIDTQMALFMSESSVSEGAGLRHYGTAGFRDMPAPARLVPPLPQLRECLSAGEEELRIARRRGFTSDATAGGSLRRENGKFTSVRKMTVRFRREIAINAAVRNAKTRKQIFCADPQPRRSGGQSDAEGRRGVRPGGRTPRHCLEQMLCPTVGGAAVSDVKCQIHVSQDNKEKGDR